MPSPTTRRKCARRCCTPPPTASTKRGGLVRNGEIRYQQSVPTGFDAIPDAYRSLYVNREGSRGKVLVEV